MVVVADFGVTLFELLAQEKGSMPNLSVVRMVRLHPTTGLGKFLLTLLKGAGALYREDFRHNV